MGTHAVRIARGHKAFDSRRQVLNGIDLDIDDGEFVVVVGQSGSGKSTLLRILAGLDSLDAGSIEWQHVDSAGRSSTGVVFQQPLLMPWLSVRENVRLGGRFRANKQRFDAGFTDELLTHFGLADVADSYPDQLSGGQAQRVAVIRAISIRPQLLLLDEPFSALDPAIRADLQSWLGGVARELAVTAVLVTHDVDEAILLGDRIVLLGESGVVQRQWHRVADDDIAALRGEVLAEYRSEPTPTASSTVGVR